MSISHSSPKRRDVARYEDSINVPEASEGEAYVTSNDVASTACAISSATERGTFFSSAEIDVVIFEAGITFPFSSIIVPSQFEKPFSELLEAERETS